MAVDSDGGSGHASCGHYNFGTAANSLQLGMAGEGGCAWVVGNTCEDAYLCVRVNLTN